MSLPSADSICRCSCCCLVLVPSACPLVSLPLIWLGSSSSPPHLSFEALPMLSSGCAVCLACHCALRCPSPLWALPTLAPEQSGALLKRPPWIVSLPKSLGSRPLSCPLWALPTTLGGSHACWGWLGREGQTSQPLPRYPVDASRPCVAPRSRNPCNPSPHRWAKMKTRFRW